MRSNQPDYLFRRKGSQNWYLKLQPANGVPIEKSMRTPDRAQAAALAMPYIAAHKKRLLDSRPAIVSEWVSEWDVGLHQRDPEADSEMLRSWPDGATQVLANEQTLTFIGPDGKIVGVRANGFLGFGLVGRDLPAGQAFQAVDDAWDGKIGVGPIGESKRSIVLKNSSPDDLILTDYLEHAGITKKDDDDATKTIVLDETLNRRAWEMWRIFREVCDKPLKECTREDGNGIVAYLKKEAKNDGREAKSATLKRRMVPLTAAANLAVKDGKLTFNPFLSCVPKADDEAERDPFSDADMKIIRKHLHKLDSHDQLLVRVLATMGVRRSEAFEIAREEKENGIRFCVIGADKGVAKRRLPFPKDLLPHLPKKITGPLFTGRQDSAGKRLSKWLEQIGIINPKDGRTIAAMHSFRHRAANRLREFVPDEALREAIGGWSNKKTSRKYGNKNGKGFSLAMLKSAIDVIGMG